LPIAASETGSGFATIHLPKAAPAGELSQLTDYVILTPKQVAERIHVPERTLERWRSTGDGPKFARLGRRVGYPMADLERWLAERTFASRAAELAQRQAVR
jgi:predicted DNA-binding transcriptional regulator AlpA